jgi:hypothetical protein
MDIGIYHGKQYRIGIIDNEKESLHLISSTKDEGFAEYINTKGKIIENMFIKDTPIRELEDAYELGYEAYYKGEKFDTGSVENLWTKGNIRLDTEDIDIAKKYEFEVMDRSWFYKRVKAEEIEALIEYKAPILQFENTKQMTSRKIPKEEIMDYAKYMASFA